jgi:putative transposase
VPSAPPQRYNSFRGEIGDAAGNVLNRQFTTETKHTKWAADVTEFKIGSSKVYLSPILDLYDSRVISATAGPSPSVKTITDGLRTAIDSVQPSEKPLVHSDQGFPMRSSHVRDTSEVRPGVPGGRGPVGP